MRIRWLNLLRLALLITAIVLVIHWYGALMTIFHAIEALFQPSMPGDSQRLDGLIALGLCLIAAVGIVRLIIDHDRRNKP